MQRTALILGSKGRFGRHMAATLSWKGWKVIPFNRKTDSLADAAWGASLIVNGWNPPYERWAKELPALTQSVIETATATSATVLIPGNIYGYGRAMPSRLTEATPSANPTSLGALRLDMENAYRAAGVKTVIVRAGDFIDTRPSGNWFDRVIANRASDGRLTYPGDPDLPHAWAFLPDFANFTAELLEGVDQLGTFTEVNFEGYTLSGHELAHAITAATAIPQRLSPLNWGPISLARPFWRTAKHLLEMRYLWDTPHRLTSDKAARLVPGFVPTPLTEAIALSLEHQIDPDGMVLRSCRVCRKPIHRAIAHNQFG